MRRCRVSRRVVSRTDSSRAVKPARTRRRGAAVPSSRVLAVVCWAHALAGCAAGLAAPPIQQIATPPSARALLTAPVKPDCTFHEIGLGDTVPDPAEAERHKLEYERRCYRRAEMRVRARLRRLQASVAAGMKPTASVRCGRGFFCLPCETAAAARPGAN
jgi:hypothetical protein